MYILNTTFIVGDELLEQFLDWARATYMPALAEAAFTEIRMARVLHQVEPGATSVAIQGASPALAEATRWHDDTAAILRDDLKARFSGRVLFFTTYMEVL